MLVLIIIALVVCFLFIRYKSQSRDSEIDLNNPASALIHSEFYGEYRKYFDYLYYKNQPKYKIDVLLESLRMGRTIGADGWSYIMNSIEDDLPYYCESEDEYDLFKTNAYDTNKHLRGGVVESILLAAFNYAHNQYAHPSKLKYWQDILLRMADSGDVVAQAGLCSPLAKDVFPEDEVVKFHEKYEAAIRASAADGDPQAQMAFGRFLTIYASAERIKWLSLAAENGNLTDAWYFLGEAYSSYIDCIDGNMRSEPLSKEESDELHKKRANCILKGAEANNGKMAGACQYQLAGFYEDGDYHLPQDYNMAKCWYRKAGENGYDVTHCLELIEKRMSGEIG